MSIADKKKLWSEKTVAKNIARSPERKSEFLTSSNIEMERCFTPDFEYPDYENELGFPGGVPLYPRCSADHVSRPLLDDAPVCRFRHCQGVQRALQIPAQRRPDRPFSRFRPADPDGL